LERSTDETRSSLKAIQKNNQAESLRRELTERLARGTRRLDEITKELIELRLRRTEQEVRLKEVILGLEIPPPDRRSANPSPE
jgi:DNA-directed RNA polymerase specialized sigma subunit